MKVNEIKHQAKPGEWQDDRSVIEQFLSYS